VDIVFWPVALDFKKKTSRPWPTLDRVAFINGAVRMSEQRRWSISSAQIAAHRRPCACAHLAHPRVGNFWNKETIFRRSTTRPVHDNPKGTEPLTKVSEAGYT